MLAQYNDDDDHNNNNNNNNNNNSLVGLFGRNFIEQL